jgi:hypothetical protein
MTPFAASVTCEPSIVTPPPVSAGRSDCSPIARPRSAGAKRIVFEPGSLFVASIASRSETPSGPGSAISPATVATSPFVASELVPTTMSRAAGAAADGATRTTRRAPAARIFVP